MSTDFSTLVDPTGQPVTGAPLGALITAQAALAPNAPAVTAGGITWRFSDLDRASNRRARWLAALGVRQNDVVFLALPNGLAYYECVFAVWKLGATPGHVSYRLTEPEFAAILALGKPKLVIGESGHQGVTQPALLDNAFSDAPLPPAFAASWKVSTSGGSTGRPKLVVDPNPAIWGPDKEGRRRLPRSIIVNPAPLYHSGPFGTMLPAIAQGGHIIEAGSFDPEQFIKLLAMHKANWAYMVPTMMARIAHLPPEIIANYDISELKSVVHMAAPCPAWVKRFWIDWLGPDVIWEVYGGTERIGATFIGGAEWMAHPGSVGRTAPGTQMAIFNEAGEILPAFSIGEIYFRIPGKPATFAYIGAEPRRHGDWTSFGDYGWLDDEGYLFIADRRTDMIISGGVNFYPAEIEAVIDAFPGVISSAVVGSPDADLGQALHAFVQVALPGPEPGFEASLREFVSTRLARPKHPRSYDMVTEPVRDEAGKVRRSAWRERRVAALGVTPENLLQ
ncbi:MAG: AMP-binding protein [Acidocella sp.]|nr:AMP-binding protein [Acidocella sp.]